MAQITLSARVRNEKGKGFARRLRRENLVPAIFYGSNRSPLMLTVKYSDIQTMVKHRGMENILLGLQIESETGIEAKTVMLKELQADPVRPVFYHADFYEVSMDKELTIGIPIRLVNIPAGVAKGGILQHVKRDLTITCLPEKLVEVIEVDVQALDIGHSVHVADVILPEGVRAAEDGNLTVAVVTAPTAVEKPVEAVEGEEKEEEAEEAKETVAE